MRSVSAVIASAALAVSLGCTERPAVSATDSGLTLFAAGATSEAGVAYHSFRIPALVRRGGALLAFAEGRVSGAGDAGDVDLVLRRSRDGGASWGPIQTVAAEGSGTWGNPTPVVDRTTGDVLLLMNRQTEPEGFHEVDEWSDRQTWVTRSADAGATWTTPENITATVKPRRRPNGTRFLWDAVGPGNGIQTRHRTPGRLVIPATHRFLISDDNGRTWRSKWVRTRRGRAMLGTNEATVAELPDGRLYRNDRTKARTGRRWVTTGTLGRRGFARFRAPSCLRDPWNQGSVLSWGNRGRLLFLNADSTRSRYSLRLRLSESGGRFGWSRRLDTLPIAGMPDGAREGGYSSMTRQGPALGVLSEVNHRPGAPIPEGEFSIAYRRVSPGWVKGGRRESCG